MCTEPKRKGNRPSAAGEGIGDSAGRQARRQRARVREALRALVAVKQAGGEVPYRHQMVLGNLVSAAVREIRERRQAGLSELRRFDYLGLSFDLRHTSWQRLRLIDRESGVEITSWFGATP